MKTIFLSTLLAAGFATGASAVPFTFFGEDLNPGNSIGANSAAAQSEFLGVLSGGIGTEDFEAATLPAISFPGSTDSITATLNGGGASIITGANSTGRFPTSGSESVETEAGGDFNVTFSSAIAAFGFFGTDIGDFDNSLVLRLTSEGGDVTTLDVGNTVGAPNGSLLFFGFVDLETSYTQIDFINDPGGVDVFGFDDLTIGDRGQIIVDPNTPSAVPLPAAGWMLLAALGGLGIAKRRKKS